MLQVSAIISNDRALKRMVRQTLADYNSTGKRHARDKFIQILEYDWLVSLYSTKSENWL